MKKKFKNIPTFQNGGQIASLGVGKDDENLQFREMQAQSPLAQLNNNAIMQGLARMDQHSKRREDQMNWLYEKGQAIHKEAQEMFGSSSLGGGTTSEDTAGTFGLDTTIPGQAELYQKVLDVQQAMQQELNNLPANAKPQDIRKVQQKYKNELQRLPNFKQHQINNRRVETLRAAIQKMEQKGIKVDNEMIAKLNRKIMDGEYLTPEDLHSSNYTYDSDEAKSYVAQSIKDALDNQDIKKVVTAAEVFSQENPGLIESPDKGRHLEAQGITPMDPRFDQLLVQAEQHENSLAEAREILRPMILNDKNAMKYFRNNFDIRSDADGSFDDSKIDAHIDAMLKSAATQERRLTGITNTDAVNTAMRQAQAAEVANQASARDAQEALDLQKQKTKDTRGNRAQTTRDAIKIAREKALLKDDTDGDGETKKDRDAFNKKVEKIDKALNATDDDGEREAVTFTGEDGASYDILKNSKDSYTVTDQDTGEETEMTRSEFEELIKQGEVTKKDGTTLHNFLGKVKKGVKENLVDPMEKKTLDLANSEEGALNDL